MATVTRTQRQSWWIAAAVVGLVYSWIAAGFRPFTAPENAMVAVPIVIALVVAARNTTEGSATADIDAVDPPQRGTIVWVVLFAALVAWELLALFSSPREDHPTLSSVADTIMSVHVGRAAMFAIWLVAGAALAAGRARVAR